MEQASAGSQRIGTMRHALLPVGVGTVPRELENRVLRQAVQENLVSFPAQVPVFDRQSRPDLQQKIVVLYFVRGWSMDDIAKRCGLGRQRMGQILTAWRIRAVKEGYLQAIEPDHPLFRRARLEQTNRFVEFSPGLGEVAEASARSIREAILPEAEDEAIEDAAPLVGELRGSALCEELKTIVDVLNNQLRLCSTTFNGNIDSCEQLLSRARTLCARLEAPGGAAHGDEEWQTAGAIAGAKDLFLRFQEHVAERSGKLSNTGIGLDRRSKQIEQIPLGGNRQQMPPRMSQPVAVSV